MVLTSGETAKFDRALAKFALAYADQTAKDYRAFTRAIRAGRIHAVKNE